MFWLTALWFVSLLSHPRACPAQKHRHTLLGTHAIQSVQQRRFMCGPQSPRLERNKGRKHHLKKTNMEDNESSVNKVLRYTHLLCIHTCISVSKTSNSWLVLLCHFVFEFWECLQVFQDMCVHPRGSNYCSFKGINTIQSIPRKSTKTTFSKS